jgi:hypothetical protein
MAGQPKRPDDRPSRACPVRRQFHSVKGGLAMGDWVAVAIGVSGLLLIEMFVFRF